MIRDFQSRSILQFVRSYRRIKLDYLATALRVQRNIVEDILVQLILDGDIAGRIDAVAGVLDLTQRVGGGAKKYTALDAWTATLSNVATSVTQTSLTA